VPSVDRNYRRSIVATKPHVDKAAWIAQQACVTLYLENMRAVIQRVSRAQVEVNNNVTGAINNGLLILLGIQHEDTEQDAEHLVRKITGLRVFNDNAGKMNHSVRDVGGSLLVVSQFTLYGDCRKGMRPSFDRAARPEQAKALYEHFVNVAIATGVSVATGMFQASMQVTLTNDGPVTLICDSAKPTSTE
jgi:D-tyrosyl-tRNA(Tyr) deacylase